MKQIYENLPKYVLLCILLAVSTMTSADDEDIPFSVGKLFFELNNTDGDLGIHGKVDGDEWKLMQIFDPNERRMLNVRVTGRLKRQGLTELFFESAEPTFDELSPEQFFRRFPEGIYEIEGITLDNEERENEVLLSHVIPAPTANIQVSGVAASEDCDTHVPVVSAPVTISWDTVTTSHPELGKEGNVEVEYYEVVVADEDAGLIMSTMLPPEVTELKIPDGFIALSGEFKYEILVRATNNNKTAVESCFAIE